MTQPRYTLPSLRGFLVLPFYSTATSLSPLQKSVPFVEHFDASDKNYLPVMNVYLCQDNFTEPRRQIYFRQMSAASLFLVYSHLYCAYVPREILLYFFPEYQLPSEFGQASLEELTACSEVSWLFLNFEEIT